MATDNGYYYGGDPALTVRMRGLNASRAALRQFDVQMTQEILATVDEYRVETRELIELMAPVRYGFMQQHAEAILSPKGYSFEAGYYADTFLEQLASWGLRPRFYPPYQEYGTRHHGAQPSVGPSFEIQAPLFQRDIEAIIRRSVSGYGRTQ